MTVMNLNVIMCTPFPIVHHGARKCRMAIGTALALILDPV
jgi:hypothetical protein